MSFLAREDKCMGSMTETYSELCPCDKYHCKSSHAALIADHTNAVKVDADLAARYVLEQEVLCNCNGHLCAEARATFKIKLKHLCLCDRPHCATARTALKEAAGYYSDEYETSENESIYDESKEEDAEPKGDSNLWAHARSLLVTLPNWLPEDQRDALQQIQLMQRNG